MFCQKCGNQLSDNAKFCTGCGNSTGKDVKKETVKVDDNNVVLNVKSKFKILYNSMGMIITASLFSIFLIILPFMFGIITGDGGPIGFAIIMLVILLFILFIWGISVLIQRAQYKKYNYDFYSTKVIYTDSFLNVTEKEVKYKFVREIVYTQGFIQRFFNIGNIMLYTNAESGFMNGILIRSVENVKEVYDNVKDIINI